MDLITLLQEWQQWEADLIADNSMWWPYVEKDKISGKTYDKMMDLQTKRKEAIESLTNNITVINPVCVECDNYRFKVISGKPTECLKCNANGDYKLKEITVCLGCGRDINKSDCSCPAGTGMSLVKQDRHDR